MKNKNYLISFFLLGIILFNFSFGFVQAFDDNNFGNDNDDINDEFEDLNKRHIEVDRGEDEIHISSIKKSENGKDQISIFVSNDADGINFVIRYRSKFGEESEFDIAFGVLIREIIEFVDVNEDGIYHPETDIKIQNVQLHNFTPIVYEISNSSELHYLRIRTKDEIFTAHLYIAEEFTLVDNILITPSQLKIDFEISNFDYYNESSQLALCVKLDSEVDFEHEEETEDEENGYAENEQGFTTTMGFYTGYLTWSKTALIDEGIDEISVSPLLVDDHSQNFYISYPRSEYIYHDLRLGIEGILIPLAKSPSPTNLTMLIILIGAVSVSVIYATYHLVSNKVPTKKRKKDREEYFNELFQEEEEYIPYSEISPLQIIFEENALEKLSRIKDLNLTVVSEDFFKLVDQFKWDQNEREAFIHEMFALSPFERRSILEEMAVKS